MLLGCGGLILITPIFNFLFPPNILHGEFMRNPNTDESILLVLVFSPHTKLQLLVGLVSICTILLATVVHIPHFWVF